MCIRDSYQSTHTDPSHLDSFYTTFDQIKDKTYDGMIITGAPLEYVPWEEVDYWEELCKMCIRDSCYAVGTTTGAPEVRPSRSSRTKDSSLQISYARNR